MDRVRVRRIWMDWIKPCVFILVICASFRSAIADWNVVPTGSMKPTILEGDRIFVNKLAFGCRVPFTMQWIATWGEPSRGDVVVFHSPEDGTRLVKRVVGLPGETIEVRQGRVWIEGKPASYDVLEDDKVKGLESDERKQARFEGEAIDFEYHPVMHTPNVPALRTFGPVQVPAGHYFVMGDNRDNSRDSRFWGSVSRDLIVGRSSRVLWSLDRENYYVPRFWRFLKELP